MACSNIAQIKIEPVNVYYQIEEQWSVTTVADVASSLNDTYFDLYDTLGVGYYVWMNVGAAGTDPAIAGKTGIEITVSADDTAAAIATLIQVAVDAEGEFHASVSGNEIRITSDKIGEVTAWSDGAVATGFTFDQCQLGGAMDMGLLDGDIEVTFEEQVNDITAHQTGTTLLTSIRQGLVNNISMTLKEADYDRYRSLMLATAGAADTPSGGTEVFGWGTASLGENVSVKARRLILNPVALGLADKSRDICFWKSYAIPESLTISGENPKTMSLSFKVYQDPSKPSDIDQFVFKDWSQYVPVYP